MTRRSIRHFTGELINDEDLDTMLRAGFQAPSAHNYQPWEFIVVRDKEKLNKIKEFHKYAKMIDNAGTTIDASNSRYSASFFNSLYQDI